MRYEKPRVKNLCGVTGGKDEDVDRRVEVKETKLGREVRPRIGWPGRKDWKRYRKQNGQVTLGNFTQDTHNKNASWRIDNVPGFAVAGSYWRSGQAVREIVII